MKKWHGWWIALCLSSLSFAAGTPEGWIEIKPGGNTACARGGEFSFFVSPGSVDKVVVDFMGGGGCWDSETCQEGGPFTDSVDEFRKTVEEKGLRGLYDRKNSQNPFKDWHHIVIPYCTGDIHWGANDAHYTKENGTPFTIKHHGGINAEAVLNWVRTQHQQPEKVLVTGCSAGAYGSIFWTPRVRQLYPHSQVYQFADSGVGIITESAKRNMVKNWNVHSIAPRWVPGLDPAQHDWTYVSLNDIYRAIRAYHHDVPLAQFSSQNDAIQTFFYEIMGGNPSAWSSNMMSTLRDLHPGVSHYVSEGDEHCILPYANFYEQTTQGVAFRDWLLQLVHDQNPPSVSCEGC